MTSLPGVPAETKNINELWDLVHQKGEDLRHAAELGKMLLDKKEAEGKAHHKAEKYALWRRIEDIATRVAALEQKKSAKARPLCQDQDEHAAGEGNDLFGSASPKQISPRSSHAGAEDANLRAENDVLKRKVDIMIEQLEEINLELSKAKKGQLYCKRASLQSCGGSSRAPSPTLCPNKRLEHGSAPASSDGAPSRVVALPIVGGTLTPPPTAGIFMKVSPHARPAAEENHDVDSVFSEDNIDMIDNNGKSKEDLERFEDEIEIPQRKEMANNLDASRLLEHNASLMVELDSKNELIEALRQQLQQEQYMTQQRGTRGRCTCFPRHAMEKLDEVDSNNDYGDENEEPNPGVREQSFMDDILNEAGGNPAFVMPSPSIDAPGTEDSENLKQEPWGAGRIQQVAPERRRSFGGVVPENIPLILSSRKSGMQETEKIADWDSKKVHQGKIPHKAGRERSLFRGKKHSSSSPPRRRGRSLDRARGRAPSRVASSRHEADGVTGVLGQSLTAAAASPLDPVIAGALETWPDSPRGVPLSWSSAMRALATVARVGGQQQQQPKSFDVRIAELDVAVEGQQASVPSEKSIHVPINLGSVKENVAVSKNDVEDKVTPKEEHMLTSLASAKLEVAKVSLMDTQVLMEEDDKLSSGMEQVVVKEEVEGFQSPSAGEVDEFLLAEKLTSPAAMKKTLVGLPVPAMGDGKFPAVDDLEPISPESVKPKAAIVKLEDAQVVPAIENKIPSSSFKQESTFQVSVMTDTVKEGNKIEDAKAPKAEDKGSPFSAQGQAPTSPVPVMENVRNDQEPSVEGHKFSWAKVQSSTPQASVKTQSAIEEREIVGSKKGPATIVHSLPTEDRLSPISPASVKLEDKAGGIQRPVAKGQEKPARPSETEKAQPLPMAITGVRDVTRNRAERKSRQAMAKLGLRAVSGVFRVTMKASNGNLLVVEKPDVFKHPKQSKYVIFGAADMEKSVSGGGGSHHPTARRAGAEAFLKPAPAKCAPREVEVPKNHSGAGRATVEDRSASAGIDPADVLTVMSHTGCVSDAAIEALRKEGGDVVNAVMYLTEV